MFRILRQTLWRRGRVATFLVGCLLGWTLRGADVNGVTREVFSNIGGTSISDLTGNPAYPANPSLESIEPAFEAPADWSDNYGTRMSALLLPPVTGAYTFWIASDDQGALYLSSDESPSHRQLICSVASWTASREWTKEAGQKSRPITLTAGQRYYLEALQKEGGGGDNLAVRWQLPNGAIEEPIPNQRVLAYGLAAPIITQQPSNLSVVEGGTAVFTVGLQRYLGATFQWSHHGTNLAGATSASCLFGPVAVEDTGGTFQCRIQNAQGAVDSAVATLTVLADTTRPTLTSVGTYGEATVLSVVFSKPVEPASATNVANYGINHGIVVLRAVFGADARTVILTTTPMPPNATHTITVNNVRDRARVPNTILPNSTASFSTSIQPLDAGYLRPGFEPAGPSSRRHGVVVSEIMYHPATRADGRKVEFVEIYNSQPWFEEIGGWRLSGAIDYTFPSNTLIQARSYRVIAANPADFNAVYPTVTGVLGPWEEGKSLPNDSATLRLRNAQGAILFEATYRDEWPWPVAADGAGHSLVLARPSYGERDARAWDASDRAGGSPGTGDVASANPYRSVFINEVLAHTDPPEVDSIELFNYSPASVSLEGCVLTDDPSTNRFVIGPEAIPAMGFRVFTADELGFHLDAAGETVLLRSPNGDRVIDAVRFGGQENGVPLGRFPDGAPQWTRLAAFTPGNPNAPLRPPEVLLNEVMYDPISGTSDDEYVELFNPGQRGIDLGGWRLEDAVRYTIPAGTVLGPGGFLVIARQVARLRANYAQLNSLNALGDFSGALANGGDHLALSKPDTVVSTNRWGLLETNLIHIVVDEVTWGAGGRWGIWAHGGGSSLERRDGRGDGRLAPNWGDSDETGRSPWVTVEATGTLDNGYADATQLHVTLLGAGEALLDDVEVIPQGGVNLVANGSFEAGADGWVFQGNHNRTSWEAGEGYLSSHSLHLRATGRGDTGANRVRVQLRSALIPGRVVTLRAKARWLKGNPNLLLRVRGNWLEAPGFILAARPLGTPGLPNSVGVENVGPALTGVRHWPALPPAGTPVTITAWGQDPDGLAHLAVNYRIDPSTNYAVVPMRAAGAGLFAATLPGQAAGTTAAFYLEAIDNHARPGVSRFPADAPAREALVRWGDTSIPGYLGTYRLWISRTNLDRWAREEKMSNNPKDLTFIYGTHRVIYNAGGLFHGSPYHSPSYDSPIGNSCDYDLILPGDDSILGETDINLFRPGNGGGEGTAQAEMQGYWFGAQFGIPFLYNRPVFLFANGQRRDVVLLDAQQPNGDFVDQWHPDDAGGDLHKVQLGFEFGDAASGVNEAGYTAVGADLNRYTTTGGVMKQARYRQTWQRRAAPVDELHDYTNIFNLVNVAQTNAAIGTDAYTRALTAAVDVEEWFKVHVVQHLYNNYDSFSFGGGQNAFVYKPEHDTWKLYLWDIDFAFGGPPDEPNLLGIGGREHGPVNSHPPFARIYWQTLMQAADGLLAPTRSNPILDSRFNGMRAGGAAVASPQGIKDFIAARRAYIRAVIASNTIPFAILSNGGGDFSTNRNLATLSGTAPLAVRSLLVNGAIVQTTWTSVRDWVIHVPLQPGDNALTLSAVDAQGLPLADVNQTVRIRFTGETEPPERIVINEIQYHPAVSDTAFVELLNTATNTAFALDGWRLQGIDYRFPDGTVLQPGRFLVVAADPTRFAETYGVVDGLLGPYSGSLDNGGETLRLLRPGPAPGEELLVNAVRYDDDPPWPGSADGFGPSLQLIDPLQDNRRVGNWAAVLADTNAVAQRLIALTDSWRYNQTGGLTGTAWTLPVYDDQGWPSGSGLFYVENAALPGPKNTPLTLGRLTYYFRTRFVFHGQPGAYSLQMETVIDDGAVIYLNGRELTRLRVDSGDVAYDTLASGTVGDAVLEGPFLLPADALVDGTNTLAVEVHQASSGSSDVVFGLGLVAVPGQAAPASPGAPNSVRRTLPAFPDVWLNEVVPSNPAGILDNAGEPDPWLEIHNAGSQPVPLDGWFLSDRYEDLRAWSFPAATTLAPGEFRVVWLDGQPEQTTSQALHAGFRAAPLTGSVALSRLVNGSPLLADALNYHLPLPGWSYGSYPDAQPLARRTFAHSTPGAPNDPALPAYQIRINEWMADNTSTLADPADGQYEDWFELLNTGQAPVDLGGCWLTDNLTNLSQFRIPSGYVVAPGERLLVWADGEPSQNSSTDQDLHVNFKLAAQGEAIGLVDPQGALLDAVTFGSQTNDVAQGRFPDGGDTIVFLTVPTPHLPNQGEWPETLQMGAMARVGEGGVILTWQSVPGQRYQVEFKSVLEEPAWTPLGDPITADGTESVMADEGWPHPQRFYRVVRLP